jgi:uncharacterized membrane protein YgdD (TMEM256/DUF423 family)
MSINDKTRIPQKIAFIAGIYGLLGVMAGAFGAHGLDSVLTERDREVWRTAVEYQLLHTVALLAVAGWMAARAANSGGQAGAGDGLLRWAAGCWGVGVVFFSGSFSVLALGGPRWVGPVTPVGGLALIVGWALVALGAWRSGRAEGL